MEKSELTDKLGKQVVLSYLSSVKLTGGAKNEQQGRVIKVVSNLLATLNGNGNEYQKRMSEADRNFVPGIRAWGVRTPEGFIEHKGETYVEFFVEGPGHSEYLLDGDPIAEKDIVGLPAKIISEKEEKLGVVLRCVKLSNIISAD